MRAPHPSRPSSKHLLGRVTAKIAAATALSTLVATAGCSAAYYDDCYYYYGYYYEYCSYYYMDPYMPDDGYTPIYYREVSEEPVPNPNPAVAAQLPELALHLVDFTYLARTEPAEDNGAGETLDEAYPCGSAESVHVICDVANSGPPSGDMLLIAYQLEQPIPFDDATNFFILGFSFDGDGIAENNFTPAATEEFHYFGNTDKYIAAVYQPGVGWAFESASLVDNTFVPMPSQARIIFEGSSVALVVPASEFISPTPSVRASLFRHTGDFGQSGGTWSGMIFPPLGEPLAGL